MKLVLLVFAFAVLIQLIVLVQLAGMVVCSLLVGFVVVFKRWLVVISDVSLLISLIFP